MDLADVAHDLYGLLPAEFTGERNERARRLKAGGDAELAAAVRALPKPTTAAWLVNALVRHHGPEVEQVAQVGAALREAQEHLDRDEVLQLNRQRQAVLRAVTQQARALARELGNPVSTGIADEVEQTLRAVMSDAEAAAAVRTGTLLRSLSGTGVGSVDLAGALALADAGHRIVPRGTSRAGAATAPRQATAQDELAERRQRHEREQRERERDEQEQRERDEREQRERERHEQELAEARAEVAQAEARARQADDALDDAQGVVNEIAARDRELNDRLTDLEQQLRDVREELADVQREARSADRDLDTARHDAAAARRVVDRARTWLARLS